MTVARQALAAALTIAAVACSGGKSANPGRSANAPTAPTASSVVPTKNDIQVAESGFTEVYSTSRSDTTLSYGIVLRNNNSAQSAQLVDTNIAFYDASGRVLGVERHTVSVMPPRGIAAIGGWTLVDGATRMQVTARPRAWTATSSDGALSAEGVSFSKDEFGMKTTATIRSSFPHDVRPYAVALYRDESGKLVGGDSDVLDALPADDSAPVDIESFFDVVIAEAVRADVVAEPA